jgi:hypothetical protein
MAELDRRINTNKTRRLLQDVGMRFRGSQVGVFNINIPASNAEPESWRDRRGTPTVQSLGTLPRIQIPG